jgi:YHS domain-containing protein
MKSNLRTVLTFFVALTVGPILFAASPANTSKNPDATSAPAGKPKPYPLKVCIVTDNDLDSMGDESSLIYEGQTIKFCCPPCEKKFLKNPARYLAKLAPPEKANAPK